MRYLGLRSLMAATLLSVAPAAAQGQPRVPSLLGPTAPSELVTLGEATTVPGTCGGTLLAVPVNRRALANGSDQVGFIVPAGQVLVLTHIDFLVQVGLAESVGAFLFVVNPGAGTFIRVFNMAVPAPVGSGFRTGASAPLGGVAVAPGTTLCFSVDNLVGAFVNLHGFLTRDR